MVGQNGYFVNPETACRAAWSGQNGQNDWGELSDGLAVVEWPCCDSWRLREANPPSRRGR